LLGADAVAVAGVGSAAIVGGALARDLLFQDLDAIEGGGKLVGQLSVVGDEGSKGLTIGGSCGGKASLCWCC
jgi:hypothetical protein